MMATETAKKIQAGPHYTFSVWEYRGIRMTGEPPSHGWGGQRGAGGGWTWTAEVRGKHLRAYRKADLQNAIDAELS